MKLLVTGGLGFIGSNFVRYWLTRYPKDHIINLDLVTYAGHISSTKDYEGDTNYKFVKGDICDASLVDKLTRSCDYIVHFAAESHVDRSIRNPSEFVRTNVLGTQVLLDGAVKNKIKRFHHVSTDEVFGSLELNSTKKFDESTPYNPRSPYSATKAASDHLVRAYGETYGLDFTVTNCSNNFGPYQDPEKMLPRFITNLIDGEQLPVYGDGLNVRDWLYVEDHCRAIDLVMKKSKKGETYLVGGSNRDINNLDLTEKLIDIFGVDESMIKHVPDRKGHDRRYSVDWTKINTQLGWEPKHPFDLWLGETVKWYTENEWWWRPLKDRAEETYAKTGQN